MRSSGRVWDGIVTSWNKGAEQIFGYSAEEFVGKPITMLIPSDRLDEEPRIIEHLRHGERIEHFETVRRRKDGQDIHVSLNISPIKDATGKVIGVSKIARDITEGKRAEEALRKAQTDLAHVTRVTTLGELTASIAHEVNQPLSGIVLNGNACLRWLGVTRPTSTRRAKLPGALSATAVGRATLSPGFVRWCGKPMKRRGD